jgi:hypothetical protein
MTPQQYYMGFVWRVFCLPKRLFRWDGCGSNRAEAVLNGNTIIPYRYFRTPRWTVLAHILSVSPQRMNWHDQIRDLAALLAHSRSARCTVGVDGVTVTLSVSPQGLKLPARAYIRRQLRSRT